jgi:murein DD-endopeptidase MepM/ murein hydrolase activator NlpD
VDQLLILKGVLVAWLVILLAACSPVGPGPVVDTVVPEEAPMAQLSTETPHPLPTNTNQPGFGQTSLSAGPSNTAPVVATNANSATKAPIQTTAIPICSPLTIHPLEELPEIISDPYRPPPPGKEQRHHGVDFSYYRRGERASIQGVGVQTVLPGVVSTALAETFPYGNLVIIESPHTELPESWVEALQLRPGYSIYTLYAHMEAPSEAVPGESVDACQPLGTVGLSGNAAEPHLHLEMRAGPAGVNFSSMGFYKADDTAEERSNYTRWRTGGEFQHFDPMLVLTGFRSD